jgi:thiol-disulfide isomerase/thioredoxin
MFKMVNEFQYPVGYLEIADFDQNTGFLQGNLAQTPTLVMIQAGFCGACARSKPEFQKLGNEVLTSVPAVEGGGASAQGEKVNSTTTSHPRFNVMTIQLDGERESERMLSNILDKIAPGVTSVPVYILFIKGQKIFYEGTDRSASALKTFVTHHLNQFKMN